MDRYWKENAVTNAPAVPDSNTGGYPTDGNASAGIEGTVPGAWWFHSITEELRNAIAALGGIPDWTKTDQLGAAISGALTSSINAAAQALAGSSGASEVGFMQAGAGAVLRTAQDKMRDRVNLLDYDTSTQGASDPSGRFAAAFAALSKQRGGELEINACNLFFSLPQSVPPGVTIRGKGMDVSNLTYTGSSFAFSTQNANGTQEVTAPHYSDFSLVAPSGIQLNNPNGGFTNDATSQAYMMRHAIRNVRLTASSPRAGTGIQYSKCFDGVIEGARISNFDVLIDSYGSDICSVSGKTTRLQGASTAAIRVARAGTFGSQLSLRHIEILSSYGGIAIDSSDRMLLVEDVYVEQASMPGSGTPLIAIIRLRGGYTAAIRNLRCEVPYSYCPNWLVVDQDMVNIDITNITTTGNQQYGPALFPAIGSKYLYNALMRQRIRYSGLTNPSGMPFNSVETTEGGGKNLATLSPNTPGLTGSNYGGLVVVQDGSFLLPPITTAGSLVTFSTTVGGTVNVGVIARTDAASGTQRLNYQLLNGGTIISTSSITINTTSYNYYPLASNVNASNIQISLYNQDLTNAGNIFVRKVSVDAV